MSLKISEWLSRESIVAHTCIDIRGMHNDLSPTQTVATAVHIGIYLDMCAHMNKKLNVFAYLVHTYICEHTQTL